MTIKQDIEREAEKLGKAVRAAAKEFASATGMCPEIYMDWISSQRLENPVSDIFLGRVTISVGGIEVSV